MFQEVRLSGSRLSSSVKEPAHVLANEALQHGLIIGERQDRRQITFAPEVDCPAGLQAWRGQRWGFLAQAYHRSLSPDQGTHATLVALKKDASRTLPCSSVANASSSGARSHSSRTRARALPSPSSVSPTWQGP